MNNILNRRDYTKSRTKDLQNRLEAASQRLGGKACVYATGSFGRLEASSHSDLDLFIVGKSDSDIGEDQFRRSQLSRLDEICIKADLINVARELNFPDFDGDGKYLEHYSADKLIKTLGTPKDDAENTLTARLLLFLESQPLLGKDVHQSIIDDVVAAYWRDYEKHSTNFTPAFLTNDILRLWRTFCVNYEARTERAPEENRIKAKVKNYKLKHSRMLTCYSALLYLLAVSRRDKTVSLDNAKAMSSMTPTERLEWLLDQPMFSAHNSTINNLLEQYDSFLDQTNQGDGHLFKVFSNQEEGEQLMRESYVFGNIMYEALFAIGEGAPLMRLVVV